jgi:ribose transport system substrate-binding protein
VVYPVDNTTMVPCAKQAIAAGIKVTSTDTVIGPKYGSSEIQVKGVSGQVVLAPTSDGKAAANLVKKACQGDSKCNVALFVGVPQLAYSAQHLKAVKSQLQGESNITIVAQLTVGLDMPDKAAGATEDLLTAHPDLDVISADDDSSLQGALRVLQKRNSKVKAIGDGGSVAGVQAIKDGREFGTVVSLPRSDVKVATEMAIKAARGQNIANPSVDYATLSPIGTLELTKENASKFQAEWGK